MAEKKSALIGTNAEHQRGISLYKNMAPSDRGCFILLVNKYAIQAAYLFLVGTPGFAMSSNTTRIEVNWMRLDSNQGPTDYKSVALTGLSYASLHNH